MDDESTPRQSRSRSRVETEDEADAVRFGSNSSSASSAGAKRMRLRGGRDAPGEMDEDDDDQNDDEFHSFLQENGDAVADGESDEKFQPGAIVRVMVENFVTYEHAEFFPGPNLNMVIGPNGTGKSSLVCAICLGLGYHSNVLGRATSFGEFVKHGKDFAIVEVELQRRPHDRVNHIIRLRINREDNSRKFLYNRKETTHKKIQALMQQLRIQIDNLCQFLPQDKVAEFAGLNAVDLLTKTLQAAAAPEMLEWQDSLKTLFVEQKAAQQQLNANVEHLTAQEARQQTDQHDVDRLREKEQMKQAIKDMEDARVLLAYQEAREMYENKKKEKKAAERKQRELEQESGPSLEAVNQKQEYQKQVQVAVDARKRALKSAEEDAEKVIRDIEKLNDKNTGLQTQKQSEIESMALKKRDVQTLRKKIMDLEARLKSSHKEFNAGEWNQKIRAQEHLSREKKDRIQELEEQDRQIRAQGTEKTQTKRKLEREIEDLESQQGQKLNQLKKVSPQVAQAWEWVQQNQDSFEKEVFGPPMLSCSVKDMRYSSLVQSQLQRDDFICIIAQTRGDHSKLTNQFYKEMKLSVNVRTITAPLSSFRRPLSQENLESLGIDAYTLDMLEGPEPVLAMLCSDKRFHNSGVALREVNEDQYNQLIQSEAINIWSAGDTHYRVARRKEYGPGATSTTTRSIRPGIFWTDQPVDMAEKAELQRKLTECLGEYELLKQQMNQVRAEKEVLRNENAEIKNEIEQLNHNKSQLQREYNIWKAIPDKIEMEKKNLESKIALFRETQGRIAELDEEMDDCELQKARLVLQHKEHLVTIRTASQAYLEAQVCLVEAKSDVATLMERNTGIMQKLEEEMLKVEAIGQEVNRIRSEAKKLQEAATDLVTGDNPRKPMLMDLAEGKTVVTLTEDIAAEKDKLELIHAADPSLLKDFETRALNIARLQRQKAAKEEELRELSEQITDLRERWEPGLDDIIHRINVAFSYNFEQINCAGEVGVYKDEDFEKWAIEIKVKFREGETLQKLDQHRQSGGERAVSTIFYLMSLQSMAQAPFRVVDEINQGMDPRNERMVHERMVEIACREHTSQYFLITPKLLSNLRYDTRMKILCIASGEHMPEEGHILDFARCVKVRRQLMAAAAAGFWAQCFFPGLIGSSTV